MDGEAVCQETMWNERKIWFLFTCPQRNVEQPYPREQFGIEVRMTDLLLFSNVRAEDIEDVVSSILVGASHDPEAV